MRNWILYLFIVLGIKHHFAQVVCLSPAPYSPVSINTNGWQMCFADFNLDGKKDIATIGAGTSSFGISLSSGSGFLSAVDYSVGGNPSCIAAGDFNNDTYPDLIMTVDYSNIVRLSLGNGDGTFGQSFNYLAGTLPNYLTIGDFNNDGNKDLAVTNYSSNTISILSGNGNAFFPTQITYTVMHKPRYIVNRDFNNDGLSDLAVSNDSIVYFLKGNANGTFSLINTPLPGLSGRFICLNADNDNRLDIVGNKQGLLSVLKNNGNFSFSSIFSSATITTLLTTAGEFNNDGLMDVVALDHLSSVTTVSVLLSNGLGGLIQAATYTLNGNWLSPFSIYSTDINGDQRDNAIVGLDNLTDMHIWLNCKGVGIKELSSEKEKLWIYPIPSSDFIEINTPETTLFTSVSIYNDLGQLIREQEISFDSESVKIQVDNLPEGVYSLLLRNSKNETLNKRFVIAR